jgi:small-conductance mechanosensitive channel
MFRLSFKMMLAAMRRHWLFLSPPLCSGRFGALVLVASIVGIGFGAAETQSANSSARVNSPKAGDIVQFLGKTIAWYRDTAVEQQILSAPGDITFVDEDRRTANQIVRLGFDFARQQAQFEAKQPKAGAAQDQGGGLSQYQSLLQAAQNADQQVEKLQADFATLKQKAEGGPPKKRAEFASQAAETQSDLALQQARRDALHGMVDFVSGTSANGMGATGLRAEIEELARSVPTALNDSTGSTAPEQAASQAAGAKISAAVNKETPSGIWGLVGNQFKLAEKKRTLGQDIQDTDALAQACQEIRTPLVASLRALIQNGDQLTKAADSADPAILAQQKQQLDSLTSQFKQTSASLLPLSKQGVLLDLYKRSLLNWQDAIRAESRQQLRTLLTKLGGLAILIAALFAVGEVWRRAIYRYIQETRRRYQFLLLRRIVLWIVIAIVVAFTFASELGSVVTFAGLITAGVAVALQNVIVSIVGYFFLIGKFGIRVGDRVQVSGVTGEVVDIGLVRFHLMELGSGALDLQPTGRVVAFSNSIVFQPSSGLFKQIPGTSFLWHEVNLTFAPEMDYHLIQQRVTAAAEAAFKDYSDNMEHQRKQMEYSLSSISAAKLKPQVRLHFTSSGVEVTVRFPVEVHSAGEIDERVMRELLEALDREPRLRLIGSAMPTLGAQPS